MKSITKLICYKNISDYDSNDWNVILKFMISMKNDNACKVLRQRLFDGVGDSGKYFQKHKDNINPKLILALKSL